MTNLPQPPTQDFVASESIDGATPILRSPRTSAASRIFFGPDGLRAGWSLLLFAFLVFAFARVVGLLISYYHLLPRPSEAAHQSMTPRVVTVVDGLPFLALLFVSWLMSLLERRPFTRYGLSLRRSATDFLAGAFWGFTMLSALIATLLAAHAIAFDGLALHGAPALAFALKWAFAFLCVGFFEEFLTRGYLQYTLARGVSGLTRYISPTSRHAHAIGFWVAAFLPSGFLFLSRHIGNPGETAPGIPAVGLAGAVFAFSLYRTGTLWWAIGMHTAWDWAQTFFYGVADSGIPATGHLLNSHPLGRTLLSGGATGPEGSLFVIPTFLLLALIIHLTLPRRAYPLTPAQMPEHSPENYQLIATQLQADSSQFVA